MIEYYATAPDQPIVFPGHSVAGPHDAHRDPAAEGTGRRLRRAYRRRRRFSVCLPAAPEATHFVELDRARDALLAHYATNGMFPTSVQAVTPAVSCCVQNAGNLFCCAAVAADWTSTPWMSFGFSQTAPQEFQFSYTGVTGGQVLSMAAIGDLDCDATTITYSLRCTSSSGVPACELRSPTNAD